MQELLERGREMHELLQLLDAARKTADMTAGQLNGQVANLQDQVCPSAVYLWGEEVWRI